MKKLLSTLATLTIGSTSIGSTLPTLMLNNVKTNNLSTYKNDTPTKLFGTEGSVNFLQSDSKNTVWAGTSQGLYKKLATEAKFTKISQIKGSVTSLLVTKNNDIFVATHEKNNILSTVYKSTNGIDFFADKIFFTNASIIDCMAESPKDGSILIGGSDVHNNIVLYKSDKDDEYFQQIRLIKNLRTVRGQVKTISISDKGEIWIYAIINYTSTDLFTSLDDGLTFNDTSRLSMANKINSTYIYKNWFYAATDFGLFKTIDGTKFIKANDINESVISIYNIAFTLIIGTHTGYYFSINDNTFHKGENFTNPVNSMITCNDNNSYIGSTDGVYLI